MGQWTYLLENLGIWDGSFTRLTPQGDITDDVLTCVALEGLEGDRTVRQTIQKFSPDRQTPIQTRVLEYSTLSRSVGVFNTGAFSQGSMQYGPFSEFGAELGFKWGDRRLRLVMVYDTTAHLASLTLIREHRRKTDPHPRPELTPDQLVGRWQGQTMTYFPDLSPPETTPMSVTLDLMGDRLTVVSDGPNSEFSLDGAWQGVEPGVDRQRPPWRRGRSLATDAPEMQWLCLPDGAAAICPMTVPTRQPFSLNALWLIHETQWQQMSRHYDASGAWTHLTLTQAEKQKTP